MIKINHLQKKVQSEGFRLVRSQLVGVCIISLLGWLVSRQTVVAAAIFLGGVAYTLPNFIIVRRAFRFVSSREAKQFVVAFFMGEMFKLAMSAFFVLIVVQCLSLSLLFVLIGFFGAMVSFWVGCIIYFALPRR